METPIEPLPRQRSSSPTVGRSSSDPITLAEARRGVVRDPSGGERVFDHTLYSRLNDKIEGAIVLITHRLHESLPSDMTGGSEARGDAAAQTARLDAGGMATLLSI